MSKSVAAVKTSCHVVRGLLGTGPPDPTLESPSPSPFEGSIWHRNRVKSGNRCRINVESMLNRCQIDPRGGEGEADSRVGSGGPVPNKPLTSLVARGGVRGTEACVWGDHFLSSRAPKCPSSLPSLAGEG